MSVGEHLIGLPSVSDFLNQLSDDVLSGKSVIANFPRSLEFDLESYLRFSVRHIFDWITFGASGPEASSPIALIRERFFPEVGELADFGMSMLLRRKELAGKVLYVKATGDSAFSWIQFVTDWETQCPELSPSHRFLVVLETVQFGNRIPSQGGPYVGVHNFWGTVGPIDLRVLVHRLNRGSRLPAITKRLVAELAIELACWDLALCEFLLGLGVSLLERPLVGLERYTKESQSFSLAEIDRVVHFDGRNERHSCSRSQEQQSDNRARIWRAHATVLLPLVETERRHIISHSGVSFEVPFDGGYGEYITDPLSLEIGHLHRQVESRLVRCSADTRELIWLLRNVRNHLSHATIPTLKTVMRLLERLDNG